MLIENSLISDSKNSCPNNKMNQPPYNPLGHVPLSDGTICMDVCHAGDNCTEDGLASAVHYNLHNLYGMEHAHVAYKAVTQFQNTTRVFLTSLSTSPGSGQFGGHWGGEPNATWENLKMTVVRTLEFNLYGIPMTGAPACGYSGQPNVSLCVRWWQMAIFQPFLITYREEPYEHEADKKLSSAIGNAIHQRYSLLPYLYTLLYKANVTGAPVMRPLFMEFPKDSRTYDITSQFLWGHGLLISPILSPVTNESMVGYVPEGCWYNYHSGKLDFPINFGHFDNFSTSEDSVNLHVRGGYIIPNQKAELKGTEETRMSPLKIYVALACLGRFDKGRTDQVAEGELFIDDGVSVLEMKKHFLVRMIATRNNSIENSRRNYTLQLQTEPDDLDAADRLTNDKANFILDSVYFFGQQDKPRNCYFSHQKDLSLNNTFFDKHSILKFSSLKWDLTKPKTLICTFF